MRQVAAAAGVDPALIRRFFGGKQQLFTEVASAVIRPAEGLEATIAGPEAQLGERIARYFLGLLGTITEPGPILGLVRSAVTSEHAATLLRGFLAENVLGRIAANLRVDHPDLRSALAASQLVGMTVARHAVRLPPLADASQDDLARWIAPVLQHHLTGPAPPRGPDSGPDSGPSVRTRLPPGIPHWDRSRAPR